MLHAVVEQIVQTKVLVLRYENNLYVIAGDLLLRTVTQVLQMVRRASLIWGQVRLN